jgi:hypothetical protein
MNCAPPFQQNIRDLIFLFTLNYVKLPPKKLDFSRICLYTLLRFTVG